MPHFLTLAKDRKRKKDSSVPSAMKKRHKSKNHQSKQDNRKKRDMSNKKKQDILTHLIVGSWPRVDPIPHSYNRRQIISIE